MPLFPYCALPPPGWYCTRPATDPTPQGSGLMPLFPFCSLPPKGWFCAEFAGHEGDCTLRTQQMPDFVPPTGWYCVNPFCEQIQIERISALAKHGPQDHLPDSTDNPGARETWETIARNACDRAYREGRLTHAHILDEETAEALTAAARGDVAALRKELIQCISVCWQWLEAIEKRAK